MAGEGDETEGGPVPAVEPAPEPVANPAPPDAWRPGESTRAWSRGHATRRPTAVLIVGLVVALAVWATGAIVLVSQLGGDSGADEADEPVPGAPTWHPDIEPIAHEVERIQGAEFEQPVAVKFLSDEEFNAQTLGGQLESPPQDVEDLGPLPQSVADALAMMRAFGFSDLADDEILEMGNPPDPEALQGFYDPLSETLFLRESDPDSVRDMIVAHELTHALDDQRFDLDELQRSAANLERGGILLALIEGNATLTADEFFETLDPAEQEEYEGHESLLESSVHPGGGFFGLPVIQAEGGAPYVLGPPIVELLRADGGPDAVGGWYENPPPDLSLVDPTFALHRRSVRIVDDLEVKPGDEPLQDIGEVDPLTFLFVLSGRIDPAPAIRAADAWSGSSSILFRRNGVVCTTAAVGAVDEEGHANIERALAEWAQSMPAGAVTVEPGREELETIFTGCDPGDAATAPQNTLTEMLLPIAARNAAIAELVSEDGLDALTAKCVADLVLLDDDLLVDLTDSFLDEESQLSDELEDLESEIEDATAECED